MAARFFARLPARDVHSHEDDVFRQYDCCLSFWIRIREWLGTIESLQSLNTRPRSKSGASVLVSAIVREQERWTSICHRALFQDSRKASRVLPAIPRGHPRRNRRELDHEHRPQHPPQVYFRVDATKRNVYNSKNKKMSELDLIFYRNSQIANDLACIMLF